MSQPSRVLGVMPNPKRLGPNQSRGSFIRQASTAKGNVGIISTKKPTMQDVNVRFGAEPAEQAVSFADRQKTGRFPCGALAGIRR